MNERAAMPVFVGVGSNVEPVRHVRAAVTALRERFGSLEVSPVYRSRPVGFEGEDFLNLVVGFESVESPEAIDALLGEIERANGRGRDAPRFAPRTLDLDLLLYGDAIIRRDGLCLPRREILEYAFVLRPLADIAGSRRHPLTGETFEALWRRCRDMPPTLTPVAIEGLS